MMASRRQTPECLSDLKLDQLLSGELPGDREQVARAHLAVCPACAARSLELSADRARFAEVAPELDLNRGSGSVGVAREPSGAARNLPARRWVGGLALAAAAMLALGVGLTEMLRERGELAGLSPRLAGTTRTKGNGVHFGFVVRRGEHTFAGEAGQTLHPGDLLRFTWSPGSPVYVGVWGIDGEGRVSAYQQNPELERLPAGQSQPLAEAVELDESVGEERLVAVQCNAAHSVRDITRALATSAGAAPLPADCVSDSLVIVKVAP